MDAEHWEASEAPAGVCRVAMDPLITSGMIEAGRLAPLRRDIRRVGAELRPGRSVEPGRPPSFLPFRNSTFTHVHCGFVLHLYLELLDLLAGEVCRVLRPGGELVVLLPHFADLDSEVNLRHTERTLTTHFGAGQRTRFAGPFTTFWADLYRDRTFCLRFRKKVGFEVSSPSPEPAARRPERE